MKKIIEASPHGEINTPQAAQFAARKFCGERIIHFQKGVYPLTEPLVLNAEDSNTLWQADPDAKVVFSGGESVRGWKHAEVNGKKAWIASLAPGRMIRGLWADGNRRERAGFPKQGLWHFTGKEEHIASKFWGDGPIKASFQPGQIRKFRNLEDVELVAREWWAENHFRIAEVNEETHEVTFNKRALRDFSGEDNGFARYKLCNVYEALTEPGEWYYDRKSGILHYIPFEQELPETTKIRISEIPFLLKIEGTKASPAENIRFENIAFQHCGWNLPNDFPDAVQAAWNIPGAVTLCNAVSCGFYSCEIAHTTCSGIRISTGSRRNTLDSCEIHDIGGPGVIIMPEREKGPLDEEPMASDVVNCRIYDGGLDYAESCGILIGNSGENRIVHNEIRNFPYTGISLGWLWGFLMRESRAGHNMIEYNHIHHINDGVLSDNGGIYALGPQVGSTIIGNYIHDIGSYFYGGQGIYLDEGASGIEIRRNLIKNTRGRPFNIHFAQFADVSGNIFYGSEEGISSYGRTDLTYHAKAVHNIYIPKGNTLIPAPENAATFSFQECYIVREDPSNLPAGCSAVSLDMDPVSEMPKDPPSGFVPFDVSQAGVLPGFQLPEREEKSFLETLLEDLKRDPSGKKLDFSFIIRNTGKKRIDAEYQFFAVDTVSCKKILCGKTDVSIPAESIVALPQSIQLPEFPEGTHQCWLEASSPNAECYSSAITFFLPQPVKTIPAYPERQSSRPAHVLPMHIEDDEHNSMFDGFGYLEGDDLHLEGIVHDPKITVNPSCIWSGSVAELFLAVSPDSPIMQYALVPPYQDQNHDVRSISVTPSPSADDMFYQAELRKDGWSFTLIMPLKKRGLDASKFYFDLIIRTSSTIKMHPYERKALWGSLMDYANANELVPLSAEMK